MVKKENTGESPDAAVEAVLSAAARSSGNA